MEFGIFEIISGFALVLLFLQYLYFSYYKFWKIRGVKGPTPTPFFGTLKDVFLHKCAMFEQLQKYYNMFPNEPLVGLFTRTTPVLMIKDPDIIKEVLIKDFSQWMYRNRKIHEKTEPLSQHLVSLEPKSWKPLRSKLSPIFTSGKLKEMFYVINECGDHLSTHLENLTGKPIEVRDLTAKFTTDVIGNCAFGLKMNALADEKSEFREMGRKMFKFNWLRLVRNTAREHFPVLYGYLYPIFKETTMTNFFVSTLKETIDYREKNNIRRNDFVDNLRDLKNTTKKIGDMEVTDTLLASQAFIFFVAGFETSSSLMSFILYELAQNHKIQDKLRVEINGTLKNNENHLTYELVKSMKYLHQVTQECLRKHPPAPQLTRKSVNEYTFSGTNVTVPPDQAIVVPIYSIHHDPRYYPDPEVFDPERFNEENVKTRHPMQFLPFGDGPRNCIGARFANYQTKVGIIKILQNHKVDVCKKTEIPYSILPMSQLLTPKNGIFLQFTRAS